MKGFLSAIMVFFTSSVSAQQFHPVFKDRFNSLSWAAALSGPYSNGCGNVETVLGPCLSEEGLDGWNNVVVEDSFAAKACQDIGARLPTLDEYKSLKANFDHVIKSRGYIELTPTGEAEMMAIFQDMPNTFWTSTLRTAGSNGYQDYEAWTYAGQSGWNDIWFSLRPHKFSVRCVREN